MGSFVGKGIIDLLSSNPKMNFLYEEGRGMGSFEGCGKGYDYVMVLFPLTKRKEKGNVH